MAFSVTAAASCSPGTISRTTACQAGPLSAAPVPIRKVNSRRLAGVSRPAAPTAARPNGAAATQSWATSSTQRRSHRSAMAPANSANRRIGARIAVWTRATMSGVPASVVISQAAPTPCTSQPIEPTRLASQMARNSGSRSGDRMPPPPPARRSPPVAIGAA